MAQAPQIITRMQSTPMLQPLSSRVTVLPLEFELSPIIRQDSVQQGIKLHHRKDKVKPNSFDTSLPIEHTADEDNANALPCTEEASTSSGFNIPENSRIELSTWIGGKYRTCQRDRKRSLGKHNYERIILNLSGTRRGELNPTDSGFSQWLAAGNSNCKEDNYTANAVSNADNDLSLAASQSPTGIHRDNTPSSLQRPDKHSQHSSLQNIQGDLNDILDRLQNMVANDCLLDGKLPLIIDSKNVEKRYYDLDDIKRYSCIKEYYVYKPIASRLNYLVHDAHIFNRYIINCRVVRRQ